MASKNLFHARGGGSCYFFPAASESVIINDAAGHYDGDHLEFDEADVWECNAAPSLEAKKKVPRSRSAKKVAREVDDHQGDSREQVMSSPSSLPVKIPDWSKIYKEDGRPPRDDCKYSACRTGNSFSVLEGEGRTLKGKDLLRTRNAILKMVGFED